MGKPTYGEFSFPSDFGFAGSAGKTMVKSYSRGGKKKPVKAQTGGEIRQGSQAPITPEERMKMEQMARQQANLRREAVTKPDRSRAEERSFERLRERSGDTMSEEERMREKYSEKPIRRKDGGSAHSDEAMDKKVVAAVLKKHADQPASKAHKGLKFGGKAVPSYKSTPKIK